MVGNAHNACFQPSQPSTNPVINEDAHLSSLVPWPVGPKLQSTIDGAEEQLQNLVDILEAEGVETFRPKIMDWKKGIKMPEWEVAN